MTGRPVTESQVFVLSGPSGAGKNTIAEQLFRQGLAVRAVTATTRDAKAGETEGDDYHFLTREEFDRWIDEGRFAEHAEYVGHKYGTPLDSLAAAAEGGLPVILTIEVDGGLQIKERMPEATLIFVDAPSEQELERRLTARGRDAAETIDRRLQRAREERKLAAPYDYRVINDDLDGAVAEVAQILTERFAPDEA